MIRMREAGTLQDGPRAAQGSRVTGMDYGCPVCLRLFRGTDRNAESVSWEGL